MESYGNENAALPDFEIKYFTSKDELFDYTSAENYSYPGGNLPICYGFQYTQDNDDWNLEIYMND